MWLSGLCFVHRVVIETDSSGFQLAPCSISRFSSRAVYRTQETSRYRILYLERDAGSERTVCLATEFRWLMLKRFLKGYFSRCPAAERDWLGSRH